MKRLALLLLSVFAVLTLHVTAAQAWSCDIRDITALPADSTGYLGTECRVVVLSRSGELPADLLLQWNNGGTWENLDFTIEPGGEVNALVYYGACDTSDCGFYEWSSEEPYTRWFLRPAAPLPGNAKLRIWSPTVWFYDEEISTSDAQGACADETVYQPGCYDAPCEYVPECSSSEQPVEPPPDATPEPNGCHIAPSTGNWASAGSTALWLALGLIAAARRRRTAA